MRLVKLLYTVLLATLLAVPTAQADFTTTGNPVHPGGTRATIDLPGDQHIRNIGGIDGAGLCVGTSNEVASRWHNLNELAGFQKWLAKRAGGSWPEQLEKDLVTYAKSKGVDVPKHVQHTGGDVEFLRRAVKTRRMTSITYGGCDSFYGANNGIAHMVNAAHLDGTRAAIIDNNDPGNWRWMDDTQLVNRWLGKQDNGQPIYVYNRLGRGFPVGGGWAVVWLTAPPPPIDVTAKSYLPEHSEPAIEQPDDAPPIPDQIEPTGDEPARFENLQPKMRYWVNGVEVDRHAALRAVIGAEDVLTDDSDKAYVSFVGADTAAQAKIAKAIEPYAAKLHVNWYTPDSWVAKTRLKSKITAQLPYSQGGKTVFTSDSLNEVDAVTAAKKALGIVDPVLPPPVEPMKPAPTPDVTPAPSPDTTPPAQPASPAPTTIPGWLVALAGCVVFLLGRKTS